MRYLYILLLLIPSYCFSADMDVIVVNGFQYGGSTVNPSTTTTISFLIDETYEGSEYDNTEPCGSAPCINERISPDPNGDKSTAGLDMVDSLCLELNTSAWAEIVFTQQDQTTVYFLGKFRFVDAVESANEIILESYDVDSDKAGIFYIEVDGEIKAQALGGALSSASSTTISEDNSTWVKASMTEGTGANATACISVWDGAAWDSYVCSSDGTETGDIDSFRMTNNQDSSGVEFQYWDETKVSLSDFTNNPTTY